MRLKKLRNTFTVLILSAATLAWAGAMPTVDEVASRLSCYCGTCPHLVVTDCGCSTADQIKADIKQKLDSGMTSDQIVQGYVAQYGQTVLSAPPKQGFNLMAWAVPFLGFIVGGTVLVVFLKRQQTGQIATGTEHRPETVDEISEDEEYRRRLEKELELRK